MADINYNALPEKLTPSVTWDKVLIIDSEDGGIVKQQDALQFKWPTGDTWSPWTNAPATQFEYSIDGSTLWHSTYTYWDKYIRSSVDWWSTWSSAMKFIGDDGTWTGDMTKSVYDTDNDWIVDDSERLWWQLPSYYATWGGTATWTNTGDQTSIVWITGTKAQFDSAVTDWDIVYVWDTISTRLTPRVAQATNYTTSVTMDFDAYDEYDITAQAWALLFNNPSWTPTNCQKRIIRIKDNGTARALTYGTQFASWAATLPTTTTISKKLWIWVEWDSTDSKWYCIATWTAP